MYVIEQTQSHANKYINKYLIAIEILGKTHLLKKNKIYIRLKLIFLG